MTEYQEAMSRARAGYRYADGLNSPEARQLCRAWAAEHGIPCPERGKIPFEVQVRYVLSMDPGIAYAVPGSEDPTEGYLKFPTLEVVCPRCGNIHTHGLSEGWRVPHCSNPLRDGGDYYIIAA
jgi:hypothetical protein